MFRNDYIMRMIAQFSEALGALIGLKRRAKPQEALEMTGKLFKRLFGLNPGLVRALSERDLIDLLNRDGEMPREKLLMMASLLKEEGELHGMLEQPDEMYRYSLKALNLSLIAMDEDREAGWLDVRKLIDELTDALAGYVLPNDTQERLWTYFEAAGRYADAEDILFELLEPRDKGTELESDRNGRRMLLLNAESFYERLLELDDSKLEAGRLPRDEVLESLSAIRSMMAEEADERFNS